MCLGASFCHLHAYIWPYFFRDIGMQHVTSRTIEIQKQRGFYVDLDNELVHGARSSAHRVGDL